MSKKSSGVQQPSLNEADQLRFEQDLPQWLAGHLSLEQAQWMQHMQQHHESLAAQSRWLVDARSVVREQVAQEDTREAWALLSQRLLFAQALSVLRSDKEAQPPKGPRWLHWLLGHPGWANAAAAAAVVLVVGQAGWIASRPDPEASTAGWRSLDLEDMPSAHLPATRLHIRVKPHVSSTEMAAASVAIKGDALDSDVAWQAQNDGSWVLTIAPAVEDSQGLLSRFKALPLTEQVQLLP
jgi:hypothetical protein